MNRTIARALVGLLVFSTAAWCVSKSCQAAPKDGAGAVVLDTLSTWRIHETLKPPVIQLDDGLKTVTSKYQWLDRETTAAPDGLDGPRVCRRRLVARQPRGGRRARPTSPRSACGRGSR